MLVYVIYMMNERPDMRQPYRIKNTLYMLTVTGILLLSVACKTPPPPPSSSSSSSTPPSPSTAAQSSTSSESSASQASPSASAQQQSSSQAAGTAQSPEPLQTQNQTEASQDSTSQDASDAQSGGEPSSQGSEDEVLSAALDEFDKQMQSQGDAGEPPQGSDDGGAQLNQVAGTSAGVGQEAGLNTGPQAATAGMSQATDKGKQGPNVNTAAGVYGGVAGSLGQTDANGSGGAQLIIVDGQPGHAGLAAEPVYSGDTGSSAAMTEAERVMLLESQLNEKLSQFDGMILSKRDDLTQKDNELGSQSGVYAAGGAGFDGADETQAAPPLTTMAKRDSNASGSGQLPNAPASNRSGEFEHTNTQAAIPSDIQDGRDDDVVAKQLREAATKETDPVLRKKLWDEYRKYTKGVIGRR
ncbi:MAG: hypothetical protein O6928_04380 [Gammaproteobacteria bacterium]|nr:hypothetical protein [Gammaproteobacteria bacterium]